MKNPYETLVKEEYLIYDLVSMISAIGGTLGLCIGFSFKECARDILGFFMNIFEIITQHKNRTKVWVDSHKPNQHSGLDLQQEQALSVELLRAELMKQSRNMDCLESKMAHYEKRLDELEK